MPLNTSAGREMGRPATVRSEGGSTKDTSIPYAEIVSRDKFCRSERSDRSAPATEEGLAEELPAGPLGVELLHELRLALLGLLARLEEEGLELLELLLEPGAGLLRLGELRRGGARPGHVVPVDREEVLVELLARAVPALARGGPGAGRLGLGARLGGLGLGGADALIGRPERVLHVARADEPLELGDAVASACDLVPQRRELGLPVALLGRDGARPGALEPADEVRGRDGVPG